MRAGFTADGAALSSYQLLACGGQPAMDLTRLVAKEVKRPAVTREVAPQLTYEAQWQASDCATDSGHNESRPARRRPVEWLVTSGKTQCASMRRTIGEVAVGPIKSLCIQESPA